jgi:hypothetical protein
LNFVIIKNKMSHRQSVTKDYDDLLKSPGHSFVEENASQPDLELNNSDEPTH